MNYSPLQKLPIQAFKLKLLFSHLKNKNQN